MDDVRVETEEEVAVGGFLPVDHTIGDHFTAVLRGALGVLDEARDGQDPAAEEAVGNVEIPVFFMLGHAEEAGGDFQFGSRFLRLVFLFRVGFCVWFGAGALGLGGRGGGHDEGHDGDQDLFHRCRILVDFHEGSDFSAMSAPLRWLSAGKVVILTD